MYAMYLLVVLLLNGLLQSGYITSIDIPTVIVRLVTDETNPPWLVCDMAEFDGCDYMESKNIADPYFGSTEIVMSFIDHETNASKSLKGYVDRRYGETGDVVVGGWLCTSAQRNSVTQICGRHNDPLPFSENFLSDVSKCNTYGGDLSSYYYSKPPSTDQIMLDGRFAEEWLMADREESLAFTRANSLIQLPNVAAIKPLRVAATSNASLELFLVPSKTMIVDFYFNYQMLYRRYEAVQIRHARSELNLRGQERFRLTCHTAGTHTILLIMHRGCSLKLSARIIITKAYVGEEPWYVYLYYVYVNSREDLDWDIEMTSVVEGDSCTLRQYYCFTRALSITTSSTRVMTYIPGPPDEPGPSADLFVTQNIIDVNEPGRYPDVFPRKHEALFLPDVADVQYSVGIKVFGLDAYKTGLGKIAHKVDQPLKDCVCPAVLNQCAHEENGGFLGYAVLEASNIHLLHWKQSVECRVGNISSDTYGILDLIVPYVCRPGLDDVYGKQLLRVLPNPFPEIVRNVLDADGSDEYAAVGCQRVIGECLLGAETLKITFITYSNFSFPGPAVEGTMVKASALWGRDGNVSFSGMYDDATGNRFFELLTDSFETSKARLAPEGSNAMRYGDFRLTEIHVLESYMKNVLSVSCEYTNIDLPKGSEYLSRFNMEVVRTRRTIECRVNNTRVLVEGDLIELTLHRVETLAPEHSSDTMVHPQLSIRCPMLVDWATAHGIRNNIYRYTLYCSRSLGVLSAVLFYDADPDVEAKHEFVCSLVDWTGSVVKSIEGELEIDDHFVDKMSCSSVQELFTPEVRFDNVQNIVNGNWDTLISCRRPAYQTDDLDRYGRKRYATRWCPSVAHDVEIQMETSALGKSPINNRIAFLEQSTEVCLVPIGGGGGGGGGGACHKATAEELELDPRLMVTAKLVEALTEEIMLSIEPRAYAYCNLVLPDGSRIKSAHVTLPLLLTKLVNRVSPRTYDPDRKRIHFVRGDRLNDSVLHGFPTAGQHVDDYGSIFGSAIAVVVMLGVLGAVGRYYYLKVKVEKARHALDVEVDVQ